MTATDDEIRTLFIVRYGQESWDHHDGYERGAWFQSECANIRRDIAVVEPLIAARTRADIAEEVRAMGLAGENDGNPATPGDHDTEVYNEAIRDVYLTLCADALTEGETHGD